MSTTKVVRQAEVLLKAPKLFESRLNSFVNLEHLFCSLSELIHNIFPDDFFRSELEEILGLLEGKIEKETIQIMNGKVDNDGIMVELVAKEFRMDIGLIEEK